MSESLGEALPLAGGSQGLQRKKMAKLDTEHIAKAVTAVLSEKFTNIKITRVDVKEDRDRDGDSILRIVVVFTGQIRDADARVVAGAARQLRPALDKIDDDMYPLLSFVSKVDYERGMRRETR